MKKEIIKPFDLASYKNGAKVKTRDGHEVRIICTDAKHIFYPIIALVKLMNNNESTMSYTLEGKLYYGLTNDPNDLVIVEEVEEPEFWSEDERIRKRIIHALHGDVLDMEETTKAIAWLEKQGEQKQEANYPKFDFEDILALQCCMETADKVIEDKALYEKLKSLHSRLHDAYWIGKQSVKPQGKSAIEAINEEKVDNANKVELNDYSSIDPHFGKPIDNVEPKFHDGQWIVWQGKYFKVNYNGCRYELTDQNGKNTSLEYGTIDETAHLWNISDAKDGDVLATEDVVFIFKHIDKTGLSLCKSYCEVIGNSELGLGFDFSINDVYPASKEQRELLHSKIKEAGYEWDAKLKQVKKIKNEIEIPYGAKDSELIKESYNIPKGFHIEVIKKGEKSINNDIWHDNTCIPDKDDKEILVEYNLNNSTRPNHLFHDVAPYDSSSKMFHCYSMHLKLEEIIRWAYMDDILQVVNR